MTVLTEIIKPMQQGIVVEGFFPDDFLDANGYILKGEYWSEKNQKFHSLQFNSGFVIYVVENKEVWIERYGRLSSLPNIKTGEDLMNLERLLSFS